jgi:hypothetical protein
LILLVLVDKVDENRVDPPLEISARSHLDYCGRGERVVDIEPLPLLIRQPADEFTPVLHEILDRSGVRAHRTQQQFLDVELLRVLVDLEAADGRDSGFDLGMFERHDGAADLLEIHVADLDVNEPETELVDVDLEVVALVAQFRRVEDPALTLVVDGVTVFELRRVALDEGVELADVVRFPEAEGLNAVLGRPRCVIDRHVDAENRLSG